MRRFLGVVGTLALAAGMLVGGAVPAGARGGTWGGARVVHPGQSIQAAIDAARSGGTVLVARGTYTEHVVITKSVNLVGFGAVLVPPPGDAPPSLCSAPGPNADGICVAGDFDPDTGAVNSYVDDVRISGFTIKGFGGTGIMQIGGSGSTFVANRATGNGEYGIAAFSSTGTTELFNLASGSGEAGFYIGDSPDADATLIANTSVDNMFGFFVRNAEHGRVVANWAHDNCLGILFLADAPGPAGAFNVAWNLIRHNDKACPGSPEQGGPLSGLGVVISGAHDVSLHANAILDNNPGGDTDVSAGVAVVTGDGGTEPANNRVQGNVILRNSTDILWDSTGRGNVLQPNRCQTSTPAGLCH